MNKTEFIHQLLDHPQDKIACINSNKETLSYRDIKQMVQSIEKFFNQNSELKYQRFGLLIEDAFSLFPVVLGCLENVVLVPIDSDTPLAQFNVICHTHQLFGLIYSHSNHPFVTESKNFGLALLNITLNNEIHLESYPLNSYPIEPELAFVISTTGTTDQAKRLLIENKAYMNQVIHEAQYFNFSENVVHIISSKPSRYVSTFIGFRVLFAGGTICISQKFNPNQILKWIHQYENVNLSLTPSGLLPLIEEVKRQSKPKGKIQVFLSGSSVTQSLIEHFKENFNARFIYNYGSSETGAITSTYLMDNPPEHTVGVLMIEPHQIRFVEGEIQIKTDYLFKGYDGIDLNPFEDGWYKTGDLGVLHPDGYLEIKGRIKELINRGGDKISPFELEKKLSEHESVLDCIVFPITNHLGYDDIGCAVVLKESKSLSLKECRAYLRQWFIPYHCPNHLIIVENIPHNENAKIQRNKLQEIYKEYLNKENKFEYESNTILRLARLHLNQDDITLDDNFFDCGGDSLKASELVSHIEHELNRKIDLSIFMKDGIIKSLNHFIYEETIFSVCLNSNGTKTPLICLHSGDGDALNYRFVAKYLKDRPVYAYQYKQKEADTFPFESIEEMVKSYLQELNLVGPIHILGDCLGGGIAYEFANQWIESGKKVGMLMLLDTPRKGIKKEKYSFINRILLKGSRNIKMILQEPLNIVFEVKRVYKKMLDWLNYRKNPNHFRHRIYDMYRKYEPKSYPQTIIYVQANREMEEENASYWEKQSKEFRWIRMDCKHGEFLSAKNSMKLVELMEEEMKSYEA